MISFYPGPSKVHEKVPKYIIDGYKQGIFSANHRSAEFEDLYRLTEFIFKKRLNVPDHYRLFFASSATECWEIIAQSLVKKKSHHFHNGAFGKKWYQMSRSLGRNVVDHSFGIGEEPDFNDSFGAEDFICVTHNETSNGTQVKQSLISELRKRNPDIFIAIDGTSSMGGVRYNWESADFWYASVQKCFGLPSGMAVIVASERVIDFARGVDEGKYYNSFVRMISNAEKWQTTHTPNILDIYLLNRSLKDSPSINDTEKRLIRRKKEYIQILKTSQKLNLLVQNEAVLSDTVITVQCDPPELPELMANARNQGIILGNGYGELKESTFRIANFPALRKSEVQRLLTFLESQG
jgi:phosphoserine aminotransferase